MVEIKKGEYEYNESILNKFRDFEETYILVDYTNKEVSIVNMYVLEDGYNINIEGSHSFVNNGVAKYEVIHVTILDKELINYLNSLNFEFYSYEDLTFMSKKLEYMIARIVEVWGY